ncbi:hypothetical protein FVER14953_21178 [Fusarium verticillioides]|nr:hypothetical protein FVER14953_21178 [Fusarium verticillioides]
MNTLKSILGSKIRRCREEESMFLLPIIIASVPFGSPLLAIKPKPFPKSGLASYALILKKSHKPTSGNISNRLTTSLSPNNNSLQINALQSRKLTRRQSSLEHVYQPLATETVLVTSEEPFCIIDGAVSMLYPNSLLYR